MKMRSEAIHTSLFRLSVFSILLLTLAACGGGGGGGATPPSEVGTLAYVVTECQDSGNLFSEHQSLHILHGDRDVTVMETPQVGPVFAGVGGLCGALTEGGFGPASMSRDAFQAVAVSPDGAGVVFEVSDEFSVNPPLPLHLPPEQKGFFWVRADGTGLRRLAPPSREPFFFIYGDGTLINPALSFSPDGRTIAFPDTGPDVGGHDATQVMALDVATGRVHQLTQLPPAVPPFPYPSDSPTVWETFFIDDRTIAFRTWANPDGLNPAGVSVLMTIKTDASHLEAPDPIHVTLPGSVVDPRFVITGDRPDVRTVELAGTPTNHVPGLPDVMREVFVVDQEKNIVQLTNFRRVDTVTGPVDVDREHVYFIASADPLGTNPSENCQIFSIERTGTDLRQLTNFHFRQSAHAPNGCYFNRFGCALLQPVQDPRTRTLYFLSSCDPLGTNPSGGQIFAMQPDGSGLRQLTAARGLVKEMDGTLNDQLPGPWACGPCQF